MSTDRGLFVSIPGKSVIELLKTYDFSLISTRGALLEKDKGIAYNPGGYVNHDTIGAIPLVVGFEVDASGYAHAAHVQQINDSQILVNLFANTFYRVFYNQETP